MKGKMLILLLVLLIIVRYNELGRRNSSGVADPVVTLGYL